jgi:hypothetical protein
MAHLINLPILKPLVVVVFPSLIVAHLAAAGTGELELNVVDSDSHEPVAVRMHLRDGRGRAVRAGDGLFFHDHFVFDGKVVMKLPVGEYSFEMERGLEYRTRTGRFTITRGAADNKSVPMRRFVDMTAEGWYSGDLHVERPVTNMNLLMLAEDLHVAMISNDPTGPPDTGRSSRGPTLARVGRNRFYSSPQAIDEQDAGRVSVIGILPDQALRFPAAAYPWTYFTQRETREQEHRHVDVATCAHSELPIWLASRQVDSLGVLNASVLRVGQAKSLTGRQPDPVIYAPPLGSGRWSTDVYYNVLNCGFRIPPSAGSGSGESTNPVGYNRVYVHCGPEFTYQAWWRNLRQGKCIVTNGPVLRVTANGNWPGHVFRASKGEELAITVDVKLATREKISYLEIIKDGRSAHQVRLDQLERAAGQLPPIHFTASGWFLVRAVCENAESYRCAFSGPFYVEFDERPRISRRSVEFLLDWAREVGRTDHRRLPGVTGQRQPYYESAIKFWERRLGEANAD